MAAGERLEREQRQVELLNDLRAIVTGPAARLGDLVARLGELRPGSIGTWIRPRWAQCRGPLGCRCPAWDPSKPREKAAGKGIRVEWLDVTATAAIGEAQESKLRLV